MPKARGAQSRSATGKSLSETQEKRQTRGSSQTSPAKSAVRGKTPSTSSVEKAVLKSPAAGKSISAGRGGASRAVSASPGGRASSRQAGSKSDVARDGSRGASKSPARSKAAPRGRSASRKAAKVNPPEMKSSASGRSTSRSRGGGSSGSAVKKARGGKSPAGSLTAAKSSSPAAKRSGSLKRASPRGVAASPRGGSRGGRGRGGRTSDASSGDSTSADDTKQSPAASTQRRGRQAKRGTLKTEAVDAPSCASEGKRGSRSRSTSKKDSSAPSTVGGAETASPDKQLRESTSEGSGRRGRARKRSAAENESDDAGYTAGDEADPGVQHEQKKAKISEDAGVEGVDGASKEEKMEVDEDGGDVGSSEMGSAEVSSKVLQDYVIISREEVPAADSSEVLAALPVDKDGEAGEELKDYVVVRKSDVPAAESSEVLLSLPRDDPQQKHLTSSSPPAAASTSAATAAAAAGSPSKPLEVNANFSINTSKALLSQPVQDLSFTGVGGGSVVNSANSEQCGGQTEDDKISASEKLSNTTCAPLAADSTDSTVTAAVIDISAPTAAATPTPAADTGPASTATEAMLTGSEDKAISPDNQAALGQNVEVLDNSTVNGRSLENSLQQPQSIDSLPKDSTTQPTEKDGIEIGDKAAGLDQSAEASSTVVLSGSAPAGLTPLMVEGSGDMIQVVDDSRSTEAADQSSVTDGSKPVAADGGGGGVNEGSTAAADTSEQNGQTQNGHQTHGASEAVDVLLSRVWRKSDGSTETAVRDDAPKSATSIDLISYNILAEVHALRDYSTADWLGKDACEMVRMSARHERLLEELKYLNGDVVCLQEVGTDYFNDTLLPAMKQIGYDGVYYQRQQGYVEGEATFYLKSRFVLESYKGVALGRTIQSNVDSSNLETELKSNIKSSVDTMAVALLTRLKLIGSSPQNFINVANIHCSWDKLARSDKQCLQVACAMRELLTFRGTTASLVGLSATREGYVICGDFNSTPDSATCQLVEDGHLSEKSLTALQSIGSIPQSDGQMAPVINYWSDGFQYHPVYGMKSAYRTVCGSDPFSTRYSDIGSVQAVDYIWFSSHSLSVTGVLDTVDVEQLEQGVPNKTLPSDHLSLKSRLTFTS